MIPWEVVVLAVLVAIVVVQEVRLYLVRRREKNDPFWFLND